MRFSYSLRKTKRYVIFLLLVESYFVSTSLVTTNGTSILGLHRWLLCLERLAKNKFVRDSNLVDLPSTASSEGIKALINQLIVWKPEMRKSQPFDMIMALWFCEIVTREWVERNNSGQKYMQSKWHSTKQLSTRYVVDLDEAFAEQQQETYYG
jgi:hypothetical protein